MRLASDLLQLLLLGIGNLLGLQCLCGILALARCDEIAGRDLTFASGRKRSGERRLGYEGRSRCLLDHYILGIGNLLGLQCLCGNVAHASCSEIAGRDLSFGSGRKLMGERVWCCVACVEGLLQLLLLGIGNLLGLQCLCGILALAHCNEIAGRDLTFASGRKLTRSRLRSCLPFTELLLELLLLRISNLLVLQYVIFALSRSHCIERRGIILTV